MGAPASSVAMARPKRGASKKGEPDIYGDMLAEAGVSAHASTSERPLKRRRAGPKTDDDDGETKDANSSPAQPAEQKSPVVKQNGTPAPMVQTMELESDDDEDDDMEFEDVEFEAWLQGDTKPLPEPQAPQDLELNLTAAMTPAKRQIERRKPLTREEKKRRAHVHQTHLLCLLSHVARRNHWCNDPQVQKSLRAHLPEKLVTLLNPSPTLSQFGRTESLKRGLGELDKLWKAKFEITERGMRRALWAEDVNQLQDYELPEDMEVCHDREDFRAAARSLQGSRDVGAQLYCALLRSAGVRARLVCSLQPLACVSGAPPLPKPKKGSASTSLSKEDRVRASMANHEKMSKAARDEITAAAGSPTARRRLGHPGAASFNFESQVGRSQEKAKSSKIKTPRIIRESPYPIYWVEILDVGHQKWQPVDAVVTHTFWKPKAMEPPITDKENVLSYVVAFEGDGTARDVTRRYAKALQPRRGDYGWKPMCKAATAGGAKPFDHFVAGDPRTLIRLRTRSSRARKRGSPCHAMCRTLRTTLCTRWSAICEDMKYSSRTLHRQVRWLQVPKARWRRSTGERTCAWAKRPTSGTAARGAR